MIGGKYFGRRGINWFSFGNITFRYPRFEKIVSRKFYNQYYVSLIQNYQINDTVTLKKWPTK